MPERIEGIGYVGNESVIYNLFYCGEAPSEPAFLIPTGISICSVGNHPIVTDRRELAPSRLQLRAHRPEHLSSTFAIFDDRELQFTEGKLPFGGFRKVGPTILVHSKMH